MNASSLVADCLSGPYDSVLGDREKAVGTFKELVVYDDDQVLADKPLRPWLLATRARLKAGEKASQTPMGKRAAASKSTRKHFGTATL